ncbi:MAG: hypothetical protein Q7R71_02400, partial [bacterium]|nr:hypothetical protein [bacterium]
IMQRGFSNILILLVGLTVIVVVGIFALVQNVRPPAGQVACTADAMQCPDGSWVGRSGPNCEFACPPVAPCEGGSCPAATTTTGGGGGFAEYHSGIRGTVMAGPTCPVERNPPDPQCADKPLQTTITVFRASDPVHAIVLMQSNASGAFQVSLPPGDYIVGAGESMLPRCTQTPATVGPSGYTSVDISCDTGIR